MFRKKKKIDHYKDGLTKIVITFDFGTTLKEATKILNKYVFPHTVTEVFGVDLFENDVLPHYILNDVCCLLKKLKGNDILDHINDGRYFSFFVRTIDLPKVTKGLDKPPAHVFGIRDLSGYLHAMEIKSRGKYWMTAARIVNRTAECPACGEIGMIDPLGSCENCDHPNKEFLEKTRKLCTDFENGTYVPETPREEEEAVEKFRESVPRVR